MPPKTATEKVAKHKDAAERDTPGEPIGPD
jgi:hypothetical protein